MSFGPITVYSVSTVSAAATITSSFTIPVGCQQAYLEIPTMTSGTDFFLQGSTDGTNFRRIMTCSPTSSAVYLNTFTIASAGTNRISPIPLAAPYMKVELSTAQVTASTYKIICVT